MKKLLRGSGVFNILSGLLFIITYFVGSFIIGDFPEGGWGGFFLIVFSVMFWPVVAILPIGMLAYGIELCRKPRMDWLIRGVLLVMILVKGIGIFVHYGTVHVYFNNGVMLQTIFGVVVIITMLVMAISILLDIPALFAKKNS
ncbi:MAG: hypothetical protein IJW96_05930 [Clostridia bacterium]|nr:hypothetical protein [Clostridia bacterium]